MRALDELRDDVRRMRSSSDLGRKVASYIYDLSEHILEQDRRLSQISERVRQLEVSGGDQHSSMELQGHHGTVKVFTSERDYAEYKLNLAMEQLGHMERMVLATIAERLLAGQKQYGKLTPGKKVWTKEAHEEALDGMVYMACQLVEGGNR